MKLFRIDAVVVTSIVVISKGIAILDYYRRHQQLGSKESEKLESKQQDLGASSCKLTSIDTELLHQSPVRLPYDMDHS